MFGAKSGFVIPKNKLSGSLIPIFQRGGGGAGKDNGTLAKLGKRKTKWGPDLTQDVAVKKGRVLAYQVRIQITVLLKKGLTRLDSKLFINVGINQLYLHLDCFKNTLVFLFLLSRNVWIKSHSSWNQELMRPRLIEKRTVM